MLAFSQSEPQDKLSDLPKGPEAFVRSLYQEVVARHPTGIPYGADMKVFTPYLSKELHHRIDLAIVCGRDWSRQHPDPNLKPEIGWLESGIFSGDNERAVPQNFHIQEVQTEKNGSFRVRVELTREESSASKFAWEVAVILIPEDGRLAVDDIEYLKSESGHAEIASRLSGALSSGCDGPRWVGFGNQRNHKKPEE
jgi:hypothetical protein